MPLQVGLWLELALITVLSAAFLAVGYVLCRRYAWARVATVLIGGVGVSYRLLTTLQPDRFYINSRWVLLSSLIATAGFMLLGAGLAIPKKRPRQRVLISVFAVVLAYYAFCDAVYLAVEGPAVAALDGHWEQGVVRQSRRFTCGAAAGATLLRAWGLTPTEGDVAIAARTSFRGTELPRLANAVRMLGTDVPLKVDLVATTFDGLNRRNRPAVLLVKKRGYRHSVTLLRMDERRMVIGDPAVGLLDIPRAEFSDYYDWSGRAIIADADECDQPKLH